MPSRSEHQTHAIVKPLTLNHAEYATGNCRAWIRMGFNTKDFMDAGLILRCSSRIHRKHNSEAAFTRLELFACIVCLALLGGLVLPVFATSRSRSEVVQCLNNLRQMGRAVQMWGFDHRDEPSWQTFVSDGGTRTGTPRPGNGWVEYLVMSNEFVTPRILACPSDSGVLVARDFNEYTSVLFRVNANSYFINVHTIFEYPLGALFGDRNVQMFVSGNCYLQITSVFGVTSSDPSVGWTNAVHGSQGNIVRVDGSVDVTSSEELRSAFGRSDNMAAQHLLRAR